MASIVKSKVTGSSVPKFKALKESQVEDSPAIPKVNPQKDFKDYMKKVSQASVKTYQTNHPRKVVEPEQVEESKAPTGRKKIKEVDPYATESPFSQSEEVKAASEQKGSKKRNKSKDKALTSR